MKRSPRQKIGYGVLFVRVLVAIGLSIPMALRFQSAGDLAVSFSLNMGFFVAGVG